MAKLEITVSQLAALSNCPFLILLDKRQLRMMEEVGFCEIDVAWRQEAFFVAGGRKVKGD